MRADGSKHDGGKRNDESKRFARARTAGFTSSHSPQRFVKRAA